MMKEAKEGQETVSMCVCWYLNLYLKEISLLLYYSFKCAERSPTEEEDLAHSNISVQI